MKQTYKIAVIGGTGKAGKYLIQQLLNKGFHIKVLIQNPEKYENINPLIKIVQGDVRNYESSRAEKRRKTGI